MIVLPGGMPGTLNLEASSYVQKAIDFCAENDTDAKRRHKQRGDRIKSTLISEYGRGDSNVRYIIDTYLDLRV